MAGVPAYITPLSYIRGRGTQYITTGIHLRSTDTIKSKWRFEGTAGNTYGCYTSGGADDNFCLYAGSASTNAYIRYNGQVVRDFKAANGTIYNLEHGPDGFFANGDQVTSFNAATFECSAPMYIFMLPNSSSAKVTARCYGLTVFRGGDQLCNFIPARNELTGEVGFYESVGGVFYENAGTGAFTAGPEVNFSVKTLLLKRRRALMSVAKHMEPIPGYDGRFWAYYEVTDTEVATKLLNNTSAIGNTMIVDGVEMPLSTEFQFNTGGRHLVKFNYTGGNLGRNFSDCPELSEIYFPNTAVSVYNATNSPIYHPTRQLFVEVRGPLNNFIPIDYTVLNINIVDIEIYQLTGWTNRSYSNAIRNLTVKGTYSSVPGSAFYGFNSRNNWRNIWLESPNLTEIGADNFKNMEGIETIVINVSTPPTLGNTDFNRTNNTFKIYVPYSADHSILNAYKAADVWSTKASQIYELNPDGTIPTA